MFKVTQVPLRQNLPGVAPWAYSSSVPGASVFMENGIWNYRMNTSAVTWTAQLVQAIHALFASPTTDTTNGCVLQAQVSAPSPYNPNLEKVSVSPFHFDAAGFPIPVIRLQRVNPTPNLGGYDFVTGQLGVGDTVVDFGNIVATPASAPFIISGAEGDFGATGDVIFAFRPLPAPAVRWILKIANFSSLGGPYIWDSGWVTVPGDVMPANWANPSALTSLRVTFDNYRLADEEEVDSSWGLGFFQFALGCTQREVEILVDDFLGVVYPPCPICPDPPPAMSSIAVKNIAFTNADRTSAVITTQTDDVISVVDINQEQGSRLLQLNLSQMLGPFASAGFGLACPVLFASEAP